MKPLSCFTKLRPLSSTPHNLPLFLLRLPPSCRSFHASPRPQFIESAIAVSHDALVGLHGVTGLPWSLSLPLFALLLRSTVILPFTILSRRANQKQVALFPLVQAWQRPLQDETMREVGHLGPTKAQSTLLLKMRAKRKEIYKRWGCSQWKNFLGLAQIPVFLTVMEALRRMCGAHSGWLGMITGESNAADTATTSVDTGNGEGIVEAGRFAIEQSFATEGALWFPNLLMYDPQLILPFVLSGSILLQIFGNNRVALALWQKRLTRGLGVGALLIGPIMLHVPSALVLYWVCSSFLAYGQAVLLDRFMPIGKPIVPCKPKRLGSGIGIEKPAGLV